MIELHHIVPGYYKARRKSDGSTGIILIVNAQDTVGDATKRLGIWSGCAFPREPVDNVTEHLRSGSMAGVTFGTKVLDDYEYLERITI